MPFLDSDKEGIDQVGNAPYGEGHGGRAGEYQFKSTGNADLDRAHAQFVPKRISSDVPTDLHGASLAPYAEPLAALGQPGLALYRAALECLKSEYDELGLAHDAHRSFQVPNPSPITRQMNPTILPEESKVPLSQALVESLERTARREARLTAVVDRGIETLANQIEAGLKFPFTTTVEVATMSGIVEYVSKLSPGARNSFLETAVRSGDKQAVGAILNAPCYLCGMNPAEHQRLHDQAAEIWMPKEVAGLRAAQFMRTHLGRASTLTVTQYNKLMPTIRQTPQSAALANLRRGKA
jgi:hypothetical protein